MGCCELVEDLVLAIMQESIARNWTPEYTTEKVVELIKEKCEQAKKNKCCYKNEERNRASP